MTESEYTVFNKLKAGSLLNEKEISSFIAKLQVVDDGYETPCWEWSGYRNNTGYGVVKLRRIKNCTLLAHRISLAHDGRLDLFSKHLACHKCDNPPCVNPDHLFVGTYSDNMIDMVAKKRHSGKRTDGARVLSDQQVLSIYSLLKAMNNKQIVEHLNLPVSASSVSTIRRGVVWSNITAITVPIKCPSTAKPRKPKPREVFKKAYKWPPKGIGIQNGKFIVRITINGKPNYLGVHDDVFEARAVWMHAYNENNLTSTIHF